MNMPSIFSLSSLANGPRKLVNGHWVPARPLPYYSIRNRLKAAWMVFTGRADAFVWDDPMPPDEQRTTTSSGFVNASRTPPPCCDSARGDAPTGS